jgi:beta-mannosidase
VQSWSVMDYYGFGKAGYHYLRRVFNPVLASFKGTDNGVELWITNDTLEPLREDITVTLGTFTGKVLEERTLSVDVPGTTSMKVESWPTDIAGNDRNRYLRVSGTGGRFYDNRHFFVDFKDLDRVPAEPKVEKRAVGDGTVEVTLTAPQDGYCWFVHVQRPVAETRYSDNYVDLAPGVSKTIVVRDATGSVDPDEITVGWR